MSICRVCHLSFLEALEQRRRHCFFWFACKGCVKKAKTKARWHKRRKNAHGLGIFSATDWLITLLEFEFKCADCGKTKPSLTLDHKRSLGEGGFNTYENMQPLCTKCHTMKARAENLACLKSRVLWHTEKGDDNAADHPNETLLSGRKRIFHRIEIPSNIQAKVPGP
mgnify:CR=1 FL=1